MEIKSAKDFWLFITGMMVAGAVFLGVARKAINRIMKRREKEGNLL